MSFKNEVLILMERLYYSIPHCDEFLAELEKEHPDLHMKFEQLAWDYFVEEFQNRVEAMRDATID